MLVQGEMFSLGIHSRRSKGSSVVYSKEECALERDEGGGDDEFDAVLSAGLMDAVDLPGDNFQMSGLKMTCDIGVFGVFGGVSVATESMEWLGEC